MDQFLFFTARGLRGRNLRIRTPRRACTVAWRWSARRAESARRAQHRVESARRAGQPRPPRRLGAAGRHRGADRAGPARQPPAPMPTAQDTRGLKYTARDRHGVVLLPTVPRAVRAARAMCGCGFAHRVERARRRLQLLPRKATMHMRSRVGAVVGCSSAAVLLGCRVVSCTWIVRRRPVL